MKPKPTFPERVEYKSCAATIYHQQHRKGERFEVRYYDVDGSLQRLTFPTHPGARKFAELAVKELAENREHFITLRGRDALEYQTAVETLAPLGLSISQAATRVAEQHQQLGGRGTVQEAIKYFLENRPQRSPDITVREVVDKLLALKKKEGEVGKIYLRDLRLRLNRFAESFQCPISKVSTQDIRDYLLNRDVSNRTRHNLRTTMTTLFNFAKAEGYLAVDHKGVPRPMKRSRMKLAIKIFSPEEMTKLLENAEGELIPTLCLQAFAGIRAEELKRLGWEHVHLNDRHIVVPDSVAKTEERRLVPVSANLAAWLQTHVKAAGPVCPYTNLANVYAHLARRAQVPWKRNGLRHSWISYRVAVIKNVPQVAFEAGNSPAMIYRNYLKFVSESSAKQWFNLLPPASNIISLSQPSQQANV